MLGPDSNKNPLFTSHRRFFPKINKDQCHLFNATGLFQGDIERYQKKEPGKCKGQELRALISNISMLCKWLH